MSLFSSYKEDYSKSEGHDNISKKCVPGSFYDLTQRDVKRDDKDTLGSQSILRLRISSIPRFDFLGLCLNVEKAIMRHADNVLR